MDQQNSSSRLPPIQTLLPSSSYQFDDQVATAAASLLQIRGSPVSARPPTLQQRLLSFPDIQPSFAAHPPGFPKPFPSWPQQQCRFIPQTKTEYQYREPSTVAGPSYLPQSISQPQHLQSHYATLQPPDPTSFERKRKRSSLSGTISRPHSVRNTLVNDKGKLVERIQAVEDFGTDIDVTGNYHEVDWEVRCICSLNVDDGFTIQCESCHVWQHAACFKIQPNSVPEVYLCERCHPRQVDAHWANAMQLERLRHQKTRNAEKKKRSRGGSTSRSGQEQENMHALHRVGSFNPHSTVMSPFAPAPSVDSAFALHGPSSASPGQREHLGGMTRNAYFDVQPAFSKVWRGASEDGESDMSPVTSSLPMLVPHMTSDSEMSASTSTNFLHPSSSCSLRALHPIARQSRLAQYPRQATMNGEYVNESSPQYDQRGIHNIHPMPSSLALFLDEKGINDDSHLAGCRHQPNAVLRPIVCGKKQNVNSLDDPRNSLMSDEKSEIAFGIFALRHLKADEEIVLGWEWDDRYVIPELSGLLKEGYVSGSENLKQPMGAVLPDLLSSFTTCACGSSAHNCAIARMEKHLNLERDRDERERAAVASLLQHRVSSMRDQPQQAEDATEAMQMDVSSQSIESGPGLDAQRGSVSEVDQSICMVHDGEEPHSTGESTVYDSAGVNTNAADQGRMNKRRGSMKHVHFPQSESESIRATRPASTNGVEEQRPKKKARTESPQPSQKTSTVVSGKLDSLPSEETKLVKEPLKELNTAVPKMEVEKDYQGLDSNLSLTVTDLVQPLLSPSTALANLSIQCAMDKEKSDDAEYSRRTANDVELSEIVPPTPSTSMSMLHSTNTSSPENYTAPFPDHSKSSPKPEHSSSDFSHHVESEHKALSTVAPLLPSLVANASSSPSSPPSQVDSSVVPTVVPKTPIPLTGQDVLPPPPEQPKKVRRRTLADWKSSKDKEREALKQQEREAKEREATKHKDLNKSEAEVGQFTESQEQQNVEGAIEVVPSQSHDDVNILGQVAKVDWGNLESSAPVMTSSTPSANYFPTSVVATPSGSPVDVQMLDVKPSHSPVRRPSLLNEAVKDTEVVDLDQGNEIQAPTDHASHINHPISQPLPLSEQTTSMSEDGEISSPLLRHPHPPPPPPPPATSQPHPLSRSTTPLLRSPSRESSRPPSRVSSHTASQPIGQSPTPRSPPRHPRSYRPPSPLSRPSPGYPSRPGHHTDNRYPSRPPPMGPRALRNGPPFTSSYHSRRPPPAGPPPSGRDRYSSQRPYDPEGERGWSNRRAGSGSRGRGFDDRGFDDRGRVYSRNSDRPVFER